MWSQLNLSFWKERQHDYSTWGSIQGSYLWWKHHSSTSDHTQTLTVLGALRVGAEFLISYHSIVQGLQRTSECGNGDKGSTQRTPMRCQACIRCYEGGKEESSGARTSVVRLTLPSFPYKAGKSISRSPSPYGFRLESANCRNSHDI